MAELGVFGVAVATADPEFRTVGENNTPVCTANLAFNRSYLNKKTDKWENEPCFMRCQVWGARAQRMNEIVKKGQPLYVTGYVKQDTWEDKDTGQKRVSYTINLRDFQLCEKNAKKKDATKQPSPDSQPVPDVDDSDMPF